MKHPKLMMGLVVLLGWMAHAQTVLDVHRDINCYKDKALLFKLKMGSAAPVSGQHTYKDAIEGSVQVAGGDGTIFLQNAFPLLDIESNDALIVVEPSSASSADSPFDIEISIDRVTHMGRLSAVSNNAHDACGVGNPDATDVECTN